MQPLSHESGPLAPSHMAMPLSDVTSPGHEIDTALKKEVFTS
jgi:hypothetical protein